MIVVAACMPGDEPPPASITSALSIGECTGMPVEAFVEDALANFAGVFVDEIGEEVAIAILFDLIGLGSSADGVFDLVTAVRGGTLDEVLWPSLAGLSPAVAESTIAAALIEIDPDFELYCGLLRGFGEGWPRTVTDLALLVNQSHGFPVSDEEMLAQPFERKSLLWEIATALDRVAGIRPPGGRHGVNAEPDTIVDSPVIQLLAAFRGAHNAFFGRSRPWAHRPFGRPQHAFDKLVYSLGPERSDAGFIGPAGGGLYGEDALEGVVLSFPPGALEDDVFTEILPVLIGPRPTGGRVPVGPMIKILPSEINLLQPVVLTLPYDPALALPHGLIDSTVSVNRYDEQALEWEILPSSMDERSVSVELFGFSLFHPLTDSPSELQAWTIASTGSVELPSAFVDIAVIEEGGWYGGHAFVVSSEGRLGYAEEQEGGTGPIVFGFPKEIPRLERPAPPFYLQPDQRVTAITSHGGRLYAGVSVFSMGDLMAGRGYLLEFDLRLPQSWEEMTQAEIDQEFRTREWTLIAGGGSELGDWIPATEVMLGAIGGLAVDSHDRIYVAEHEHELMGLGVGGDRVRRIEATGERLISTVVGTGESGFNGDGPMPATEAKLHWGRGLAPSTMLLEDELLFVADTYNQRVRAVNLGSSTVYVGEHELAPEHLVTILGHTPPPTEVPPWRLRLCWWSPEEGQSTTGGLASKALLNQPVGVTVAGRDLVVSDYCNDRLLVMPLNIGDERGDELTFTLLAGAGENEADRGAAMDARTPKPGGLWWEEPTGRLLATHNPKLRAIGTEQTLLGAEALLPRSTEPELPRRVVVVSGDGQSAVVGTTLEPFVVEVRGSDGRPVPGVEVRWSGMRGSIAPSVTLTDSDGRAGAIALLDIRPRLYSFEAESPGAISAAFSATALAGEPVSIGVTAHTCEVGKSFIVYASVKDEFENGVDGVLVRWATNEGVFVERWDTETGPGGAAHNTAMVTGDAGEDYWLSAWFTHDGVSHWADAEGSCLPAGEDPGPDVVTLVVSGIPSPTIVGSAASVTVEARDRLGNRAMDYTGTITFTSSDAAAKLPSAYNFVAGDNGIKTFTNGVLFETAGTHWLAATDTLEPLTTGQQEDIEVRPAPADALTTTITVADDILVADGHSSTAILVKARDAHGNELVQGGDIVCLATTHGSIPGDQDPCQNGEILARHFKSFADGSYVAVLVSSTDATEVAVVRGTINGEVIADSATVEFVPAGSGDGNGAGDPLSEPVPHEDDNRHVRVWKVSYSVSFQFQSESEPAAGSPTSISGQVSGSWGLWWTHQTPPNWWHGSSYAEPQLLGFPLAEAGPDRTAGTFGVDIECQPGYDATNGEVPCWGGMLRDEMTFDRYPLTGDPDFFHLISYSQPVYGWYSADYDAYLLGLSPGTFLTKNNMQTTVRGTPPTEQLLQEEAHLLEIRNGQFSCDAQIDPGGWVRNAVALVPRSYIDVPAHLEPEAWEKSYWFTNENVDCWGDEVFTNGHTMLHVNLKLEPIWVRSPFDVQKGATRCPDGMDPPCPYGEGRSNQYVYSDGEEARLSIGTEFEVPPDATEERAYLAATGDRRSRVQWRFHESPDENVQVEWTDGAQVDPQNDPSSIEATAVGAIAASIRYLGMPFNYDDFGPKPLKAMLMHPELGEMAIAKVDYEVFFPKTATNHPNTHPVLEAPNLSEMPNWLYYYIQPNQPPVSSVPNVSWNYDEDCFPPADASICYEFYAYFFVVGDLQHNQDFATRITFTDCSWIYQMRMLASASEHEQYHEYYFRHHMWRQGPYRIMPCRTADDDWSDCRNPDGSWKGDANCWADCNNSAAPQRFLKNVGCFVRDEFGIPSTEDSQACWEARDEQEAQEAERDYCDFHVAAVHYDFANPGPNWLGIQPEACRLSGSP